MTGLQGPNPLESVRLRASQRTALSVPHLRMSSQTARRPWSDAQQSAGVPAPHRAGPRRRLALHPPPLAQARVTRPMRRAVRQRVARSHWYRPSVFCRQTFAGFSLQVRAYRRRRRRPQPHSATTTQGSTIFMSSALPRTSPSSCTPTSRLWSGQRSTSSSLELAIPSNCASRARMEP